ncbi:MULTISPECIES: ATP-binding protein [unclassified Microbacterium]|uniref:ATP-binding protein n=1 Tax=unclassified Microbacterium TaxID=2609290 RepID=UPI0038646EB0
MSADPVAVPFGVPPDATVFTRARIERILGLVVGVGSIAMGAQAFANALTSDQEPPLWRIALVVIVFVPLALMILAGVTGFLVRIFAGAFAVALPVALILWPVATVGRAALSSPEPWIWYLLNVAIVASVLVFPLVLQCAWAVGIPLLYGVARMIQVGGGPDAALKISRDVVFAVILAVVMILVAYMLRRLAADLDHSREAAVSSYATAAAAAAAEQERVSVAALMHDSVLAALIAVERADTPREHDLAVAMSREALTRLANADRDAEEGPDAPVEAEFLVEGIRDTGSAHGVDIPIRTAIAPRTAPLPGRVARALVLAAAQAIVNALEHAYGVGIRAEVAVDDLRVIVRISDEGEGFDARNVAVDRLGIRGSIVARVAAVGGQASVKSSSRGTVVELRWERSR